MYSKFSALGILILGCSLSSGCAHTHLRWNTVKQAQTLTDVYEKQVLDNLAMFACNPDALPYFAYPSQGSADVNDRGSLGIVGDPRSSFFKQIDLDGTREMKGGWTLSPVTDANKLRRMQCAYQQAVGMVDETCKDCCKLEKRLLTRICG